MAISKYGHYYSHNPEAFNNPSRLRFCSFDPRGPQPRLRARGAVAAEGGSVEF
jgi:hypothetical protein